MGVKIVKATNLASKAASDDLKAYVVIEVDEPSQRFQTKSVTGANFAWDQNFSV